MEDKKTRIWKPINKQFLLLLALYILFHISLHAKETLNLSGAWSFALDQADVGIKENWSQQLLREKISLPGALQSQGFGNEITKDTPWVLSLYDKNWSLREEYKNYTTAGNVKVPFISQPPKHYLGAAWYQKEIEIPANWENKRITLFLERPHWESTVWIDGKKIGSNLSLVAEHEFDLGFLPIGKHRITIRVDNRMILDYRPDAHSISDSLGQSWNGIVGKIELRATSPVWIEDAQVYPNYQDKSATVKIKIGNSTNKSGNGTITGNGKNFPISWNEKAGSGEIKLDFPNAKEWNEFHPRLFKIELQLTGENADDKKQISFGFAQISTDKTQFKLNGMTISFRGTHSGGDFPLTGYPPTDVEYWKKVFLTAKKWGLNHFRFHSYCPPEAAFQAADEVGIYLQPEAGMWNVFNPGTPIEKMLYDETDRMIKAYGNHPSYLMLSPSNEPKGRWKEVLDKWIAVYRQKDPRRLYTDGTGHTGDTPNISEGTDYLAVGRDGPKMMRGTSGWFGRDFNKSLEGVTVPLISHELGQWDSYPDYDIIKKFTGYLRPGNYEIFRDSMEKKGLLTRNKDFAWASGKFQVESYKEEIEANLRTRGISGYQLLDLHDYLGQGTALVGVLDTFWEEKGYVTADEFKRFNNETVPLARFYTRLFKTDEKFEIETEIAHFGEKPLVNATAYWKIVDKNEKVVASGEFPPQTINIGKNIPLGRVLVDLSKLGAPNEYKLVIGIKNTTFENDWKFWVYPSKIEENEPKDVVITHSWDEAESKLKSGAKVLFMPRKADLDWTSPPLDNVPVFWTRLMNPAWGRMLGLWIDKKHPALNGFPTESYFEWQWTELVKGSRAINLDRLPKDLQPIIQPIDDWNRNYKLGMLFEAKVGTGKLMVVSPDLENNLDKRIVARSLRKSILDYMAGPNFNPQVAVSAENFRENLFDTRVMKKLGAKVLTGGDAAKAIDGDPNTFWTAGDQKKDRTNQELTIAFPNPVPISGIVLISRQNHRDHEGDIRDYLIQISDDGTNWRDLKRGALVSTYDPQKIIFGQTVSAKFLKIISISGFGADKTTAVGDLAVIYEGQQLPEDTENLEYKTVKSASTDIDEGNVPEDPKPKPKSTPAKP